MIEYVPFIDLRRQNLPLLQQFHEDLDECIFDSQFIQGDAVYKFEEQYKSITGRKYVQSCGNGTDALFIALRALGIGKGDEVITTAHSWIATSESITLTGAEVVFCDVDPNTLNIDPKKIERKITSNTRAIIVVHIYGNPAEMDEITKIAKKHKIKIVEDCAQAHLASLNGRQIGQFGDISTYSFFPTKNLGALGDGGAVTTDSKIYYEFCKSFSQHGGKGIHNMEGINSRLDSLQAKFLTRKIPKLREDTVKRRKYGDFYNRGLEEVKQIRIQKQLKNSEHSYHLYTICCERRDELRHFLKQHKIDTNINYPVLLPFLSAYNYQNNKEEDYPSAYKVQKELLSLPLFIGITTEEQEYVVTKIKEFYKQ